MAILIRAGSPPAVIPRLASATLVAALATTGPSAHAEDALPETRAPAASASSWQTRYEAARAHLVAGQYDEAEEELRALAKTAPSRPDAARAVELADLSRALSVRTRMALYGVARPRRSRDELWLLYTTSFLYGIGTGGWFLLQAEPGSALTATIPFAVLASAPVLTVALVDGYRPLPRGLPQGISAGAYLGLGEAIWLAGFQSARAELGHAPRWRPADVATVLWGGATLGAVLGGAIASGVETTQGRISFTGSTAIWSGAIAGMAAGAIVPEGPHRTEASVLAGGAGYNAGILGGMLLAGRVSPTTTRVRIVDLSGLAGGLAFGGVYLAAAHTETHARTTLGLTTAGTTAGLALGWILTSGMERDVPAPVVPDVTWHPALTPVTGGSTVGVAGTF